MTDFFQILLVIKDVKQVSAYSCKIFHRILWSFSFPAKEKRETYWHAQCSKSKYVLLKNILNSELFIERNPLKEMFWELLLNLSLNQTKDKGTKGKSLSFLSIIYFCLFYPFCLWHVNKEESFSFLSAWHKKYLIGLQNSLWEGERFGEL